MTNWVLIAITLSFTLMFSLNIHSYAWHENLGIDNNKAAELYQTKPNDPAIVQWKNALQLAFNKADTCFDVESALSCQTLISTITSNCESHPNELLACNDSRFAQFPSILKQAQEAQIKTQIKNAEKYGIHIINACIPDRLNLSSSFEPATLLCDADLRSILKNCNMTNMTSSTFNYCLDERFIGYLKQHNILNSTDLN